MRIAIVSREVVPFFGAGIGTYAAEMSRAWAAQGHEVHFLCEAHAGFAERGPVELNALCHTVAPERDEFPFASHSKGVRRVLNDLHARAPFDYIEFPDYWAEGYFAIGAHRVKRELQGAVLGVRLHTPTLECRALNGESHAPRDIAHLERAEAAAIRLADVVISPSTSLLQTVRSRIALRAPCFVVPYPFRIESVAAVGSTSCDRPTVLYFGRLERRKGVGLLVDAGLRMLDRGLDASFRFIGGDTQTGPGSTSMLAHLRAQIGGRFADRFAFEPRRPRAEVFAIIRGVTERGGICCFPSLWENFPNVCLEAMSLGAAVVGSDAGGMSEIIEDGISGILFRAGDASSLDSALSRALTDERLRRTAAANAPRRIASLCDPAAVVTQMVSAIDAARGSPEFGGACGAEEFPVDTFGSLLRRAASRVLRRGR